MHHAGIKCENECKKTEEWKPLCAAFQLSILYSKRLQRRIACEWVDTSGFTQHKYGNVPGDILGGGVLCGSQLSCDCPYPKIFWTGPALHGIWASLVSCQAIWGFGQRLYFLHSLLLLSCHLYWWLWLWPDRFVERVAQWYHFWAVANSAASSASAADAITVFITLAIDNIGPWFLGLDRFWKQRCAIRPDFLT